MTPGGDAETPGTPTRIGRYRVVDELASGGMATLYVAATDGPAAYEKVVALKRIHPHLARERRFLDMFLDEARLAARIVHPNVCGVIDFGEADGQYFLAMDFLAGVPLSELLRAVARSPALAADGAWLGVVGRIVRDAAEGLHAAHELRDAGGRSLGVVHRDVSPQNIFIGFDGTTRVLDFGIAAAADRLHHTSTGEVKGKYAYMAPEQVNQDVPDRRIDVWALGVVAWEALTLHRLFRREGTAATIYSVLEDPIEPPSADEPRLPQVLDAPVMTALERDRERRFATTRQLGEALRDALAQAEQRLAEPWEVAAFVRRALPDREEALRTRIVTARARRRPEPGPVAPLRRPLRGILVAVALLAALGLLAGAWTLGAATPRQPNEDVALGPVPASIPVAPLPPPIIAPATSPRATAPALFEDAPPAPPPSALAAPRPERPTKQRTTTRAGTTRGAEGGGVDLATEW